MSIKSCLKHSPPGTPSLSVSGTPEGSRCPSPPPTPSSARKCVSFCPEAEGLEVVFEADDWDRSPTPMTPKLSYQCVSHRPPCHPFLCSLFHCFLGGVWGGRVRPTVDPSHARTGALAELVPGICRAPRQRQNDVIGHFRGPHSDLLLLSSAGYSLVEPVGRRDQFSRNICFDKTHTRHTRPYFINNDGLIITDLLASSETYSNLNNSSSPSLELPLLPLINGLSPRLLPEIPLALLFHALLPHPPSRLPSGRTGTTAAISSRRFCLISNLFPSSSFRSWILLLRPLHRHRDHHPRLHSRLRRPNRNHDLNQKCRRLLTCITRPTVLCHPHLRPRNCPHS